MSSEYEDVEDAIKTALTGEGTPFVTVNTAGAALADTQIAAELQKLGDSVEAPAAMIFYAGGTSNEGRAPVLQEFATFTVVVVTATRSLEAATRGGTQDVGVFRQHHAGLAEGRAFVNAGRSGGTPWSIPWRGQPFMVSEFGGTWWNPEAAAGDASWGYGERPGTVEEFYERFEGLCTALLDNRGVCGYCYTQLTDVYQEQNGIYGFDRGAKFDIARLRAAQQRPAAIEQDGRSG